MIGAIAGDIIGSVYEWKPVKRMSFELFPADCRFTDDTVMTIAIADALMSGAREDDSQYVKKLQEYGQAYPNAGYGGLFRSWIFSKEPVPYNSFGNGSAMRVSPVGFMLDDLDKVLLEAKRCAAVTHNHPEGIKGAQAIAAAIYLAREGHKKSAIRNYLMQQFGYNLNRTLDDIRPTYFFNVTCQGSVPQSIIAFLESTGYEDAVRKAVSLGGDSDTMACITGGIAEAYYGGVPDAIVDETMKRLDERLLKNVESFYLATGRKMKNNG
jgi:ADP-ribosylglycohydrolase